MSMIIFLAVIFSAFASSFATLWLEERWIYSKPEYKETQKKLDDVADKIATLEKQLTPEIGGDQIPVSKKKSEQLQQQLQSLRAKQSSLQMDLQKGRLTTTLATTGIMIGSFIMMGRIFSGYEVARLPFEPFAFFQRMTSTGLPEGSDPAMFCGYLFVYIMVNMSLRANMSKITQRADSSSFDFQSAWKQAQEKSQALQK